MSWSNARLPRSTAFVVELPPGVLSSTAALRSADAVLALAHDLAPRPRRNVG